jgi:hypothetical protein
MAEVEFHMIPVALLVNFRVVEVDWRLRGDTSRARGGRLGGLPPSPQAVPSHHLPDSRPTRARPAPQSSRPETNTSRQTQGGGDGSLLPPTPQIHPNIQCFKGILNETLSEGKSHSPSQLFRNFGRFVHNLETLAHSTSCLDGGLQFLFNPW